MKGTLRELVDKLRFRKRQYATLFGRNNPIGESALVDLARFSRAFGNEIAMNDHDATLIMAGRREAFWRVWQHLHLEPEELVALYRATVVYQGESQ